MRIGVGVTSLMFFAAGVMACGSGGGGTPPVTVLIAKGAPSGDGQHAIVGQGLANPLKVLVTEDGAAKVDAAVTWSTNSAGVVITPSGNTDADGVATGTITLGTVAGPDTVRATLAGASGSPVRFIVFADPGAAAKLGFTAQPHAVETGAVLVPSVRVAVQDASGNTVTGSTAPVTLAFASNPSGATLSGGGPVNAVSGVATFPALSVDAAGIGYTLTATSGALTATTSNGFAVTDVPPPPSAITVTVGPGPQFRSERNNSVSPAVDTLAVGGTVTWNHAGGSHNVRSTGSPAFTSSFGGGSSLTVMGATYQFQFNTAGTYQYNCGIHGTQMSGRVVVKTP